MRFSRQPTLNTVYSPTDAPVSCLKKFNALPDYGVTALKRGAAVPM